MRRLAAAAFLLAFLMSANAQSSISQWSVGVSIPEGNWQLYRGQGAWAQKFGFLGVALEGKYYYTDSDAVSLKFGYLLDFPRPVGARLEKESSYKPGFSGVTTHSYGYFLLAENNHVSEYGLNLSYGLALTAMTRTRIVWIDGMPDDKKSYILKPLELGLTGGLDYLSPWNLYAGIQYAPTFLSFRDRAARLEYAHIAFLDLGYMIGF
jgi:hypothetical protein